MKTGHFLIVLFATVLGISALYAPQPLLPFFRAQFGVSEADSALLVTVAMLPLGFAPLVYGFFLEAFSSRIMMALALLLLALAEAGFALGESFPVLLGLRLFQGLAIPALLTSIMTYISGASDQASLGRVMAVYIATTTVGGFCGRFFAGQAAAFFSWRAPFWGLAASLFLGFVLVLRLPADDRPAFERLRLGVAPRVLALPGFLRTYALVFCIFFVFSAVLNFLPYRVAAITGEYSASRTGMMYFGYLMGVLSSTFSSRAASRLGGETRAIALGVGVMFVSVALFSFASVVSVFVSLFVLCTGMFLSHSLAPGLLNRASEGNRGVVNGLYISFYYAGGALGSYLPGLVQERLGWAAYVGCLFVVLGLALFLALGLRSVGFKAPDGPVASGA